MEAIMTVQSVSDMSIGDLRAFVESIIEEHMEPSRALSYRQQGDRPVEEMLQSMRANLWLPPPGSQSGLEMLREGRDR
jgi:hypothetical protein